MKEISETGLIFLIIGSAIIGAVIGVLGGVDPKKPTIGAIMKAIIIGAIIGVCLGFILLGVAGAKI